jgi:hypothetical protein
MKMQITEQLCWEIKMQTNPGYQNTIDSCPVEFTTIRDSFSTDSHMVIELPLLLRLCGCLCFS